MVNGKLQISVVAQIIITGVKTGQVMVGKGDAVTNLGKGMGIATECLAIGKNSTTVGDDCGRHLDEVFN